MLAVTQLNIKQAPIERKPGPGMNRGMTSKNDVMT